MLFGVRLRAASDEADGTIDSVSLVLGDATSSDGDVADGVDSAMVALDGGWGRLWDGIGEVFSRNDVSGDEGAACDCLSGTDVEVYDEKENVVEEGLYGDGRCVARHEVGGGGNGTPAKGDPGMAGL